MTMKYKNYRITNGTFYMALYIHLPKFQLTDCISLKNLGDL